MSWFSLPVYKSELIFVVPENYFLFAFNLDAGFLGHVESLTLNVGRGSPEYVGPIPLYFTMGDLSGNISIMYKLLDIRDGDLVCTNSELKLRLQVSDY